MFPSQEDARGSFDCLWDHVKPTAALDGRWPASWRAVLPVHKVQFGMVSAASCQPPSLSSLSELAFFPSVGDIWTMVVVSPQRHNWTLCVTQKKAEPFKVEDLEVIWPKYNWAANQPTTTPPRTLSSFDCPATPCPSILHRSAPLPHPIPWLLWELQLRGKAFA